MKTQTFGLTEVEFGNYTQRMADAIHWINTGEKRHPHAAAEAVANLLLVDRPAVGVIPGFTFSVAQCYASWAHKLLYSLVGSAYVLGSLHAIQAKVAQASGYRVSVEITADMDSVYPETALCVNLPDRRVVFLPNQESCNG